MGCNCGKGIQIATDNIPSAAANSDKPAINNGTIFPIMENPISYGSNHDVEKPALLTDTPE